MAYEPYEWKAKDNITTARLNHIEQGIASGGGAMVVSMDLGDTPPTSVTFPMTWKEVNDTITSGTIVIVKVNSSDNSTSTSIVTTFSSGGKYRLVAVGYGVLTFSATSENDYPVLDDDVR